MAPIDWGGALSAAKEHVKKGGLSACRSLLLLPPWGEKGGMRGACRESMHREMSPRFRESKQAQISLRICGFAPAARPPHPDPLPPRGEREQAAASGVAEYFTCPFAGHDVPRLNE